MSFWDYGKFVSWEYCIEANRICNLETCPDTMNCCVSNCVGVPTISGFAVVLGFALLLLAISYFFTCNSKLLRKKQLNPIEEKPL